MAPSGLAAPASRIQLQFLELPRHRGNVPVCSSAAPASGILLHLRSRHHGKERSMRWATTWRRQSEWELPVAIIRTTPHAAVQVEAPLQVEEGLLQVQESTIGRRRLLFLLTNLPLAQLLNDASAAAIASASSRGSGEADESIEVGTDDSQSDRDLFGFDGLGKSQNDYAPGKVVALAQAGDGAVLFLGVDGFQLPLQLVVGPAEAMAVLTAVQERKSRRPVTHEAWGLSLAAIGWKVDRVAITGNEGDVFYSCVVLSNTSQLISNPSGLKKSVDMRPSDGIALALRCKAPLFICKKVANDILGAKADPTEKLQVDPLKEPGLQANSGDLSIFVQNLALSIPERKNGMPVVLFMDEETSKVLGTVVKVLT